MTLDRSIPAPRDAWAELVACDPEALAFQRPAWLDAIVAAGGYEDASRLYVDGSARIVVPLARRTGALGPLGFAASLPYGWGFGGVVAETAVTEVRLGAIVADLASAAGARLSVRPSPVSSAPWSSVMPPDAVRVPRVAHVLDLDGGFDETWSHRFTGAARRYVRIAERSGLTVERGHGPRELDAFYGLYLRSVERWAAKAGPAPARWWVRHRREARRKFELAATALGDDLSIWVAYAVADPATEPVAAIVVLRQGASASYWRGAMDEAVAGRTRANYLLHRLAIEDAAAAGCRTYHMGETGTSESLARFKTRLGARPVEYAEYRLERVPLTAATSRGRHLAEAGIGWLARRAAPGGQAVAAEAAPPETPEAKPAETPAETAGTSEARSS